MKDEDGFVGIVFMEYCAENKFLQITEHNF